VKEIKDQSINSEDANLNGSTIMLYGPSEWLIGVMKKLWSASVFSYVDYSGKTIIDDFMADRISDFKWGFAMANIRDEQIWTAKNIFINKEWKTIFEIKNITTDIEISKKWLLTINPELDEEDITSNTPESYIVNLNNLKISDKRKFKKIIPFWVWNTALWIPKETKDKNNQQLQNSIVFKNISLDFKKCSVIKCDEKWNLIEIDSIEWMDIFAYNKVNSDNNWDWCYLVSQDWKEFIYSLHTWKKYPDNSNQDAIEILPSDDDNDIFCLPSDENNNIFSLYFSSHRISKSFIQLHILKNWVPTIVVLNNDAVPIFEIPKKDFNKIMSWEEHFRSEYIQSKWDILMVITGDSPKNADISLYKTDWSCISITDELKKQWYSLDLDLLKNIELNFAKNGLISLAFSESGEPFAFFDYDWRYLTNISSKFIENNLKIDRKVDTLSDIWLSDDWMLSFTFDDPGQRFNRLKIVDFTQMFTKIETIWKNFLNINWKTYLNKNKDYKKSETLNEVLNDCVEVKEINNDTIEINNKKYNKKIVKFI
jgi:hypothetical protein